MIGRITRGWEEMSPQLSGAALCWTRTASGYVLLRDVRRLLAAHAGGRFLDTRRVSL